MTQATKTARFTEVAKHHIAAAALALEQYSVDDPDPGELFDLPSSYIWRWVREGYGQCSHWGEE